MAHLARSRMIAGMALACALAAAAPARAEQFDTALILAVDVSGSMDDARYRVQFEGVARSLEDPSIVQSLLGGPHHRAAVSMLAWSDNAHEVMSWQVVANAEDARRVAGLIRAMPRVSGEFTCLAAMLRDAREGLARSVAGQASATVIDVSGDGPDNCSGARATEEERDNTVAAGVTINGLPIRTENEFTGAGAYRAPGFSIEELRHEPHMSGTTIEDWYKQHVIGGPNAFHIVANGYADFERAFRRKFLREVASGRDGARRLSTKILGMRQD
ncbi:Protein of unknown function [Rhodoblastus acidophilus]|uniref:DUF1194 domain-containing protein n=1 Tax=Rhodoblastus acidophilus TaxID=1074 RepID=A0A212SGU8_RHOAC|nr:DUF1194 domain-containing protein [Rhodoblastus acidophilus]PPQ34782.1 DUF1194 domain-containing protein [Rhodoblastus acidophilus]RAI16579.1 DUF1194 domain-containing protein [Rhodoblastus acidophilus]SNB84791.1 Protein of unknown function [Rhodoblastus acidophilus]